MSELIEKNRKHYYKTFFPYLNLFKFLKLINGGIEFWNDSKVIIYCDFIIINNEVWNRNNNFNPSSFYEYLNTYNPQQLHFGSLYYTPYYERRLDPSKKVYAFNSKKFEIDMDIMKSRSCCGDQKKICASCWKDYCIEIIKLVKSSCLKMNMKTKPLFFYSGNKSLYIYVHDKIFRNCPIELLMNAFTEEIKTKFQEFSFDEKVTKDLTHSLRLPYSINNKTGNIVSLVDENDIDLDKITFNTQILIEDKKKEMEFKKNLSKFDLSMK